MLRDLDTLLACTVEWTLGPICPLQIKHYKHFLSVQIHNLANFRVIAYYLLQIEYFHSTVPSVHFIVVS